MSVTDINDCKPEFTRSSYNATVLEGSPKGFSILTVTTSDCDYEPEFTDVNFSLEGPDSGMCLYCCKHLSTYYEANKIKSVLWAFFLNGNAIMFYYMRAKLQMK